MRKLIVAAFISLDGVVQAPGGPEEDTSGGFAYGDWIWPYGDGSDDVMDDAFTQPFELLLGRGKRLFDDRAQASAFRLEASRTTSTGVPADRCVREGAVRIGSFAGG